MRSISSNGNGWGRASVGRTPPKLKHPTLQHDHLGAQNWTGRHDRHGIEFAGLCPLHPETRPSFHLNNQKTSLLPPSSQPASLTPKPARRPNRGSCSPVPSPRGTSGGNPSVLSRDRGLGRLRTGHEPISTQPRIDPGKAPAILRLVLRRCRPVSINRSRLRFLSPRRFPPRFAAPSNQAGILIGSAGYARCCANNIRPGTFRPARLFSSGSPALWRVWHQPPLLSALPQPA